MHDATRFAQDWVAAWNSHDLERILSHYADDFAITTPMIKTLLGVESGTLTGKQAIREYWQAGLAKIPDLHFKLIEVTTSPGSIAIYYEAILGKRAIEVMFFNPQGLVERVIAHYN